MSVQEGDFEESRPTRRRSCKVPLQRGGYPKASPLPPAPPQPNLWAACWLRLGWLLGGFWTAWPGPVGCCPGIWLLLAGWLLLTGCCWLAACPAAGWLLEKVRIQDPEDWARRW